MQCNEDGAQIFNQKTVNFWFAISSDLVFYLRMHFPNIHRFTSVKAYFQDFYNLNQHEASFTTRSFAEQVKWPHSYLHDLMSGRKPLTINRSLEFARLGNFTDLETERLITMGLAGSCPDGYSDYFFNQLKIVMDLDPTVDNSVSEEFETQSDLTDTKFVQDPLLLALLSVILWSGGELAPSEMAHFLFSYPELHNSEVMEEKLRALEEVGCIERKNGKIHILRGHVFFISPQCQPLVHYVEQLVRMLNSPLQRGAARTGYVVIPKNKILEMNQRISALANWLLNTEKEFTGSLQNLQEAFPVKYDLFVNYAIDLQRLGYSLNRELGISEQTPGPISFEENDLRDFPL